jgi:uncharacterized protein (DUF58 family)
MTAPHLAMFRSIELRVHRYLSGQASGDQLGVRLGPGSEAEEVVRYRPGEDDVRRIDWNVTARSQEPHVWRSRAEHELDTWIVVDDTPSMHFGTAAAEKRDVALQAASAVALMTDRPGNRVGVARLTDDKMAWISGLPPRVCAAQLLRGATEPPALGTGTGPSLADGIEQVDRRHRRPGLRVVVSDFVEPDGAIERPFPWEASLRRLARRHEVLVVEVVDPRELTLVDVGPVVMVDPETGHRCEVWTSLASVRDSYARGAAHHREQVAEAVRAAGVAHLVLRTDQDWLRQLAGHVLATRRRRIRGPVSPTAPTPSNPRSPS